MMIFKKKIFYFILLVFIGCLAPRGHRLLERQDRYSGQFDSAPPDEIEDPVEVTDEEEEIDIPEQYSHCKFSKDGISGYKKNTAYLGALTVCQSSENERKISIQIKKAFSNLCFVPVSVDDENGGSIYIGEGRCRKFDNSKTLYPITLHKNRAGFSEYSIDGVMIMINQVVHWYEDPFNKYKRNPDAYIVCQERLAQEQDRTYCDVFQKKGNYIYWQFSGS